MEFNDVVQPIELPAQFITDRVSSATVTGWGGINPWDPRLNTDGGTSNTLSCVLKETQLDITLPSYKGKRCDSLKMGLREDDIP